MNKIFTIGNIDFYDINTTILYTSEYNYKKDAIEFINNRCVVISKDDKSPLDEISESLFELFNCTHLKAKENLTKIDELKITILNNLTSPKKIFVFLNVLTYLDNQFKEKLISYLKEHEKIILNYTSEIEETLLFDYLIIVHDAKVVMEGPTKITLGEEKIIKKLGFNLPFIVELSSGLKYYGLTNKLYYNNESLVNDLWK
ncbi:MAG: hypothetical protein K2J20_03720 [Bacilli bacterium]|nr:hypothetical protein [Bacilli bacterium]